MSSNGMVIPAMASPARPILKNAALLYHFLQLRDCNSRPPESMVLKSAQASPLPSLVSVATIAMFPFRGQESPPGVLAKVSYQVAMRSGIIDLI